MLRPIARSMVRKIQVPSGSMSDQWKIGVSPGTASTRTRSACCVPSDGYRRLGPRICRYRTCATCRTIIFVVHDLKTLRIDPVAAGIDVVVSGHSHVPKVEMVGGVLYLNPGSAGRRRFRLPITLATLDITPDGLRPTIHDLGQG
jgi:hypothetical protein